MKVGDVIMDNDLGQTGIVLEFVKRCTAIPLRVPVVHNYYRVLYDDGLMELVCPAIDDVTVVS